MLPAALGQPILIFLLRLWDVSLGTIRMIMVTRGMRKWAALTGFVQVTIWVVAVGQVITHLDNLWNILGYSGGFAAGTLLGMWIEDKLALGYVEIHIVSMNHGRQIAERVRQAGYGATLLRAEGKSGPVYLINVVVPRKQSADLLQLVNEIDESSFITVEEARQVVRGYQPVVR